MARLPQPGSDKGTWGDILNDYLATSHNSDGSLKDIPQSKVTNLTIDLMAKADATTLTSSLATKADAIATSNAIALKAPLASPSFTGTVSGITSTMVGAEPAGLSTATQTSLNNTAAADAAAKYRPIPSDMTSFVAGASNPLTKRATHVLGASTLVQSGATVTDWNQRTVVVVPVPTVRWRLRVANHNTLNNVVNTTPVSVTGVYLGTPLFSTTNNGKRFNGDSSTGMTSALPGFAVPIDGTTYTSAWITDSTIQFGPKEQRLLSLGVLSTTGGSGIGCDSALQSALVATSGASGRAGDQVIVGTTGYVAPGSRGISLPQWLLDVQIEYEFVGPNEVGLFVGDSITAGIGGGDNSATNVGALSHETFPGAAALRSRFAFINLGVPSAGFTAFADLTTIAFNRVNLTTTIPDFAVIALGTNQLQFYTTEQANYATLIDTVASIGIPRNRIYVTTIMPRGDATSLAGTVTTAAIAGATSVVSSMTVASGQAMSLGTGPSTEAVNSSGAATGTGPYTIPLTTALTKAHPAGDQVLTGMEFNRQFLNDWLRQLPKGVGACIDFELLAAARGDWTAPDPRMFSADKLHPLRVMYQRMGAAVAESVWRY